MALRAFAARSHLAHAWIDLEDADDADVLLAGAGPAAGRHARPSSRRPRCCGTRRRASSPSTSASRSTPPPGYLFDLVVVGTGPAGLAAAVYGASEGLDTVSLDAVATGGQAGRQLADRELRRASRTASPARSWPPRAAIQAQRLGARLNAPCEVAGLRAEHGFHVVALADGSEIPTRAVIVATGARYQRLAVDDLERFEGAGVYYAATDLEARICGGARRDRGRRRQLGRPGRHLPGPAGQPGVASPSAATTSPTSMSRYLIERIEADPRIDVLTDTEVRALARRPTTSSRSRSSTRPTGERRDRRLRRAVLLHRRRAGHRLARRDASRSTTHGFVLTDRSCRTTVVASPRSPAATRCRSRRRCPGVFAVGDVRHGSMKRVAAAVGEGSSAVRSVHDHLATAGGSGSAG